jgi:phage shock protein A
LEDELKHLAEGLSKFEQDINKLESKLRETKAKQMAMRARETTASSQLRVRRQIYDSRIEDAMTRCAQMEKRIDNTESEIEAYDLGRGKTLHEQFVELEGEVEIEAELQALKTRLKQARNSSEGG